MGLVFDEQMVSEGNFFKFENRLKSAAAKFIEGGALYVTYFALNENSSTTDRWLNDVDKLFGREAPLRYNQISGFPLYGFNNGKPDNTDEQQIEDINVDGDAIIIPSTIVPHPNDFFSINYVGTPHLFQVTNVSVDSIRPEGFFQIHYHLITTSTETYQSFLKYQVLKKYKFDMKKVGTDDNPVISEESAVQESQITYMINSMIDAYRALFYNDIHNCFMFYDQDRGRYLFDMCMNEFMAKNSIMNYENCGKVIVLHHKLRDPQLPIKYHNSVWNWLELGAEPRFFQKFYYLIGPANAYPYSSFVEYGIGDEVFVIHPLWINDVKLNSQKLSYFDEQQFETFINPSTEPLNEYEKIIWKFMHNKDSISASDISIYTGDALMSSIRQLDIFLYTPMVIYIMRRILSNQSSQSTDQTE